MGKRFLFAALCFAAALLPAHAQDPETSLSPAEELKALYQADQADRQLDWGKFSRQEVEALQARDRQRRERVLEIVRAQQLAAGDDYYYAAMILQHGDAPQHFLLAHVLATAGAFKGHPQCKWLSAATLDRYMTSLEKQQFFGTQFFWEGSFENMKLHPPLNGLVTEALRQEFNVPPPEEVLKRFKEEQDK